MPDLHKKELFRAQKSTISLSADAHGGFSSQFHRISCSPLERSHILVGCHAPIRHATAVPLWRPRRHPAAFFFGKRSRHPTGPHGYRNTDEPGGSPQSPFPPCEAEISGMAEVPGKSLLPGSSAQHGCVRQPISDQRPVSIHRLVASGGVAGSRPDKVEEGRTMGVFRTQRGNHRRVPQLSARESLSLPSFEPWGAGPETSKRFSFRHPDRKTARPKRNFANRPESEVA
ncbi:hypothetical protein Lal_00010534 [Lupinus albus]|nr:hypothetical protein Lal_00010534 [Lupinus albus]